MAGHNELGKNGENQAAAYLEAQGYVIRHRNWRSGKKELDLVAEKDGELVVVEVKDPPKPELRTSTRSRRRTEDTAHRRFDRRLPAEIRTRPPGTLRHHHPDG